MTPQMKIRFMKNVSEGTKKILLSRSKDKGIKEMLDKNQAVAVCHGDIADVIYASDIAEKAAGVSTMEIVGSCPQHLVCIGIIGDVAAVEAAIQRISQVLDIPVNLK